MDPPADQVVPSSCSNDGNGCSGVQDPLWTWACVTATFLRKQYSLRNEKKLVFIRFWKCEVYSDLLVPRNREWFKAVYPKLAAGWEEVGLYKSGVKDYTTLLPKVGEPVCMFE